MRTTKITNSTTKIERIRIEKGISRTELAKQSGVPVRTLENWSNRSRLPRDVYQLYKIAKTLGCQIEDLIEPELADRGN